MIKKSDIPTGKIFLAAAALLLAPFTAHAQTTPHPVPSIDKAIEQAVKKVEIAATYVANQVTQAVIADAYPETFKGFEDHIALRAKAGRMTDLMQAASPDQQCQDVVVTIDNAKLKQLWAQAADDYFAQNPFMNAIPAGIARDVGMKALSTIKQVVFQIEEPNLFNPWGKTLYRPSYVITHDGKEWPLFDTAAAVTLDLSRMGSKEREALRKTLLEREEARQRGAADTPSLDTTEVINPSIPSMQDSIAALAEVYLKADGLPFTCKSQVTRKMETVRRWFAGLNPF